MKIALSLILICIAGCTRPLPSEEACGFVLNTYDQRVAWHDLPIQLYVDSSVPSNAYPALNAAIFEINTSMQKEALVIKQYGFDKSWNEDADGYSVIYWNHTWNPEMNQQEAYTRVHYTGDKLYEADIRVDGLYFVYDFSGQIKFYSVDLQSLFTHELGHVLGLAHTNSAGSIMNPTLNEGQNRRNLSADDIANLRCVY